MKIEHFKYIMEEYLFFTWVTDIKIIIKFNAFIWRTTCALSTFPNIKSKMCFNATFDEDFMIFE